MNVTRFDSLLKQALGDPSGLIYTAAMRQAALSEAVRAYSRFFPLKRRFGAGAVYTAVAAAGTTVYAVGGPFVVGDEVIFDPGTSWEETRTILTVARDDSVDVLVGTPLKYTVAALSFAHPAGTLIERSSIGLTTVADQGLYIMPADFVRVDEDSFGIAIGVRTMVKRIESFYDSVYRFSENIGGVGFGLSATFGAAWRFIGAWPAVPGSPSGLNVGTQPPGAVQYSFLDEMPRRLQIAPVPSQVTTYEFYYWAEHLPETVPDQDMDSLLLYARYSAGMANALGLLGGGSWKEDDVSEDVARTAESLKALASQALERWDIATRKRPVVVSG